MFVVRDTKGDCYGRVATKRDAEAIVLMHKRALKGAGVSKSSEETSTKGAACSRLEFKITEEG